ncbi:TIGR04283 family arsenosugar biosynthesis glycosyltransferase [Aridibaculum aurantiacum]|uniref:TIGR04283 family arsenosugar biosynthesis glycosyltransferase n=1 Tax=Aridibaculum aurantiacum TaxID=2810307 RepID=UPI001A95FEEB|nr:TIGR04283 family arsenosugar biosynthesis glycosyltransferase [Aridibaculum aurantiacum]
MKQVAFFVLTGNKQNEEDLNQPMPPTISIIIPTYNEEQELPKLLTYLQQLPGGQSLKEIIVADGGSTDATIALAEQVGATVVVGGKGRAKQMNAAAKHATGDIIYFLHADSYPPANALAEITKAVKNKIACGCFRLRFNTTSYFLKMNAWLTRFDINAIRFGDQSLFVTRHAFEAVQGFDEAHIILEDQEIITRLRKQFSFTIIPYAVTTSDRKYRENGYVKLQAIFFVIYILYKLNIPQPKLVSLYRKWIRKGKV